MHSHIEKSFGRGIKIQEGLGSIVRFGNDGHDHEAAFTARFDKVGAVRNAGVEQDEGILEDGFGCFELDGVCDDFSGDDAMVLEVNTIVRKGGVAQGGEGGLTNDVGRVFEFGPNDGMVAFGEVVIDVGVVGWFLVGTILHCRLRAQDGFGDGLSAHVAAVRAVGRAWCLH